VAHASDTECAHMVAPLEDRVARTLSPRERAAAEGVISKYEHREVSSHEAAANCACNALLSHLESRLEFDVRLKL